MAAETCDAASQGVLVRREKAKLCEALRPSHLIPSTACPIVGLESAALAA
jgi:hypothetical protein